MKSNSKFTAFILRAMFLTACLIAGFSGFAVCQAQSVTGRWKGVSMIVYYSAEGAKRSGKTVVEKTAKEAGDSEINYKPDHTFTMRYSAPNSSEVETMSGTWSQTGNQLSTTLEPQYNPKGVTSAATVSLNGNTMVITAVMPPPSSIQKSVSTSIRM